MEEKIIEAVRGRPVLYDTSNTDYLKTKLKLQIWDQIAKEIGVKSGSDAKIIWEKLRHSLRDALRRQKKLVRSGVTVTTLRPWKFQKKMGFLQPFMANRKKEANIKDEYDDDDQNQKELDCEDIHEADCVMVEHTSEERLDADETPGPATSLPGISQEAKARPQKHKNNLAILPPKSLENWEKRPVESASERAVLLDRIQPPSDPLYHFFMCMYETTKQMPLSSQHILKNAIYKAVADMEATLLNIPRAQ